MFKGLYASLYVDNTASYTRVKQLKLAHLLNTLSFSFIGKNRHSEISDSCFV